MQHPSTSFVGLKSVELHADIMVSASDEAPL